MEELHRLKVETAAAERPGQKDRARSLPHKTAGIEKTLDEMDPIAETKGVYLGQPWRIDRRGVVYWNEKPYIRLTFTFSWEEKQIRLLAQHGIRQFALPIPEDLFQRDEKGVEEAAKQADRTADLIGKLGGTFFAGLSNFLAPLHPDTRDELHYVERSVVEVEPASRERESLHAYALRYRPSGRRLPGPWVLNVPDKMRMLRYTGKSRAYFFDPDRSSYREVPGESLRVRLLPATQATPAVLGDAKEAERQTQKDELAGELRKQGADEAEREEALRELTGDQELGESDDEETDDRKASAALCFEIHIKGFPIPARRHLKLVVLHEMVAERAVTDELGTLPAVWKPGVRKKFLHLVQLYRRAFRKPGLRGMDFGEEQHLLDISFINPFNLYPDFRGDHIALAAYRRWLRRRFGKIERLNQYLGSSYNSFNRVEWRIPLTPLVLPDSVYQKVWRGELDTVYDCGLMQQTFGVYGSVKQMARLDSLQWEFRDWLYAHHLASLARQAQRIVGCVPTFVASSDFDDHPLRRFRFHRMLMEEGMEGMIRNWYTAPVRGPGGRACLPSRTHQNELPVLLERAMRAAGKTKTLLANEIGWPGRERWPVFPSKQDLRAVIGLMGSCGYRGFHLFSDPTSPEAQENVRWVAELQGEMPALMLSAGPTELRAEESLTISSASPISLRPFSKQPVLNLRPRRLAGASSTYSSQTKPDGPIQGGTGSSPAANDMPTAAKAVWDTPAGRFARIVSCTSATLSRPAGLRGNRRCTAT